MTQSPCPPLTDAAWPAEIADLRDGFAGQLNVYRTMAHHPALLRAWAPLRQHVVKDSALGPIRSEVVILRTGVRLGSSYEWQQHVSRARKLGMTDARIAAIRDQPVGVDGAVALGLEAEDLLILNAVDALLDDRCLAPGQEARLADALGRPAVIDLIATVGFYSVLGYLLMTYATPLDEDIAQELATTPAP